MPFPSERLAEFEAEIREAVDEQRSRDIADVAIVCIVLVASGAPGRVIGLAREQLGGVLAFFKSALVSDYERERKPGHCTVVVCAPEGDAVFHVKIAR